LQQRPDGSGPLMWARITRTTTNNTAIMSRDIA
jgi:hypothetical protein